MFSRSRFCSASCPELRTGGISILWSIFALGLILGGIWREAGAVRYEEVIDRYIDDIVKRVGTLSRPMKIVYDCGNGAGALVAPQLMRELGAAMA